MSRQHLQRGYLMGTTAAMALCALLVVAYAATPSPMVELLDRPISSDLTRHITDYCRTNNIRHQIIGGQVFVPAEYRSSLLQHVQQADYPQLQWQTPHDYQLDSAI